MKGVGLFAASTLVGARASDEYSMAALLAGHCPASPARLALYAVVLTGLWLWGLHDARRSAR